MHTNDAATSVARLVDLGANPFLVRGSLLLVLGQRLLRTVCTGCAAPDAPSDEVLTGLGLRREDLAGATPMRGRGCLACDDAGERGRIAVAELLSVGPHLRGPAVDLGDRGRRSRPPPAPPVCAPCARTPWLRAHRGEVTYEEVLRTTPEPAGDPRSLRGVGGGGPAPAVP